MRPLRWVGTLLFLSALTLGAGEAASWARALEARGVKVSAGVWEADTGRRIDSHQTFGGKSRTNFWT